MTKKMIVDPRWSHGRSREHLCFESARVDKTTSISAKSTLDTQSIWSNSIAVTEHPPNTGLASM